MRIQLYTFAFCFFAAAIAPVHAQVLEVTNAPPITPQNLITNIFLGDGVEVLSVTYEGSSNAVGFFKDGQVAVGMERGIVMTTGRAVTQGFQFGVAEAGSVQASVDNGSNVMDPDMEAIAGGEQVFNVTKYIITFIPIADTLRFRYAFGSEEYPEYVCSDFNDIFGFFISGPGINGPYQNNAANIALIPGTNLPVRINNVNPGQVGAAGQPENCNPPRGSLSYSQYYNDNDGSGMMPVYDGITDVFTAEAIVQPCQIYTIKLVICDVGDAVFDSGVFLEAKSFGTGSLDVNVATASLDGSVAEGCAAGRITFSLPNPVESNYYIDFNVLGDAVNGVDYVQLPDSLFIPAGQTSVSFDIIALEDDLPENSESLLFDVQRDACNRDTFLILIRDNPLIKPDLGQDPTICAGDPVQLDGTIPITLPPLPTFSNTNNLVINPTNVPVFSNINVSGVVPNVLGPDVLQSICIDSISHPWIDDLDIFLITPGGQFLELTTDNGGNGGNGLGMDYYRGTCFTPDATVPINFPGPFAPPSAVPFSGNWLPEGEWPDIWGGPVNGQWRLQLIDDTNGAVGTLHSWTITFNRIYDIEYAWSPAAGLSCADCPDPQAAPLQPVNYILTASDSYGCVTSDTISFNVTPQIDAPAAICGATTENSVTVAWQDVPGAAGYEINVNNSGWSSPSGALEHVIDGLSFSETVDIYIRSLGLCPGPPDTLQCQALACSPPDLSATTTDASCAGLANGSVALTSSSASGALTFELNGITNNNGIYNDLAPGLYVASLTDAANCPATVQFTISAPQALSAGIVMIDSVRCNGGSDGAATVSVSGGQGPYTYAWDNGETGAAAIALDAGPHSVTITDQAGCSAATPVAIPEPPALTLTTTASAVSCPGAGDGSAGAAPVGGTAPYNFLWDTAAGGQTSVTAAGLPGGTYQVTVTDAEGCTAQATSTVAEAAPIFLQVQDEDARCFGEASGTATAMASGGNGGFSYAWSNGQNAAGATGLAAGAYTVTATDLNGCRDSLPVNIGQPAQALGVLWQLDDPSCSGTATGQALASISGGTPGYALTWEGLPPGSDPLRQNMAAGTYAVTISDANNCLLTDVVTLADPPLLTLALSSSAAQCHGGADGTASVTASGGTGAYTFLWSNGQTSATAGGLSAGPASVTVTDANGCAVEGEVQVDQFTPLILSITSSDALCNGSATGSATASASGGAGGYTFAWSNGQNDAQAVNLPAGVFDVILTDANGCTTSGNALVAEPEALTGAVMSVTASCSPDPDGVAEVAPNGGTAPYTYQWSDPQQRTTARITGLLPGTYSVTVTDANGCVFTTSAMVEASPDVSVQLTADPVSCHAGSNGAISAAAAGGTGAYTYSWSAPGLGNTPNPSNLPAGTYALTVTDERNCRAFGQVEITQPLPVALSAAPQHIACAGNSSGSIDLTTTGGTPPYRFAWSNGTSQEDPAQLQAGVYTVTVTDANDCLATLDVSILQTTPINAVFTTTRADCYGAATGAASASISGGSAPYTYQWSNGAGGAAIQNVPSGEYDLAVTDAVGCRTEFTVFIPQPEEPLSAAAELQAPSCFGEDNGRIELQVRGGTPDYLFSIDGQRFSGNRIFIALPAGSYNVTVRDANGCTFNTGNLILPEPPLLALDLGPDITLSYGDSLRLNPQISGAVEPVLYEWKPRDSLFFGCLNCPNPVIRPLFQRAVTLVITDANGCSAEDLLTVFVVKDPRAFVPTGFTPNGDGKNDRLLVHGRAGTRVLSFRVFDRWGQLLYEGKDFEVNDPATGWDGTFRSKPVNAGAYIWSLVVEYEDENQEVLSGETNVIR